MQFQCLVCRQFKKHNQFIAKYEGYYYTAGILRLSCRDCEPTLLTMSREQVRPLIHRALHRYYTLGQVIYTLRESDTNVVRYVGRTCDPKKRLQHHIHQQKAWSTSYKDALLMYPDINYTNGYWLYDLKQRGAKPIMNVVETVADGPLVVERETRWICHCLQQGIDLVNSSRYREEFTKAIRPDVDYLRDELLPQGLDHLGYYAGPNLSGEIAFIRE